jgi:hypothetical protein
MTLKKVRVQIVERFAIYSPQSDETMRIQLLVRTLLSTGQKVCLGDAQMSQQA